MCGCGCKGRGLKKRKPVHVCGRTWLCVSWGQYVGERVWGRICKHVCAGKKEKSKVGKNNNKEVEVEKKMRAKAGVNEVVGGTRSELVCSLRN